MIIKEEGIINMRKKVRVNQSIQHPQHEGKIGVLLSSEENKVRFPNGEIAYFENKYDLQEVN